MSPTARPRTRMTGVQRRLQLMDISRQLFSSRGVDGTTIEEIARSAGVSKPIVYEHFGSKEALYMEVVTNEYRELLARITESLSGEDTSRVLLEKAALAILTYIEDNTAGFRILVRDAPPSEPGGTYATLLSKVTEQVEEILADEFTQRGFSAEDSSIYAQMLVGMVAMTAQWWLDARVPDKRTVAAHVVNLAWYGLTGLRKEPGLRDS
ncbi:TetR/AcrR family transcriptional regulator [Paeniglutamicibacter sp. Y32M11]|uniref:TetR/AcrR family transcriptional regulator n=1 Tax=Paeniglutamicibacter sp. Y32M11 TaxID=2853258 RepID=UPI002104E4EE|nr:TetR/AcrR family transcriptional regulator [Paeniglutamicibacter sp. Y32M11]